MLVQFILPINFLTSCSSRIGVRIFCLFKKFTKITPSLIFISSAPQKEISHFQNFHIKILAEFKFILVFNFINSLPPSLLLPTLLLDDHLFVFTTKQSLKFVKQIILTDQCLLSFPGTVVYFSLIYVFSNENFPPILKFFKIAPTPPHSRPPAHLENFHFIYLYF